MQGVKKSWLLQFACYAGALVTSLVLQVVHPDLFALLCTPLPVERMLSPTEGLDLPLNHPVVPKIERVK